MTALLTIWTVLVLVVFLGIVIWAWSGRNKAAFDAAARIPLEDDPGIERTTEDTPHG